MIYNSITNVHVYSRKNHANRRFVNQVVRVGTNDPRLTGSDPSDNPICDTMPLDTPCIEAIYVFHCGSPGPLYGRYISISLAANILDTGYPHILVLSEVLVFIDTSAPTAEDTCSNTGRIEPLYVERRRCFFLCPILKGWALGKMGVLESMGKHGNHWKIKWLETLILHMKPINIYLSLNITARLNLKLRNQINRNRNVIIEIFFRQNFFFK